MSLLSLSLACAATETTRPPGDASLPAQTAPGQPEARSTPAVESKPAVASGPAAESEPALDSSNEPSEVLETYPWKATVSAQDTVRERVAPPPGYRREPQEPGTFSAWLRTLPVRPGRPPVYLYDGRLKGNQDAHALVLDIDTGNRDLQQCADAVMRLRAEYLFAQGRTRDIHFNFTTGDRASYEQWVQGARPQIQGNQVSWKTTARADASYEGFRKYLDSVFTYAGSASLSRELVAVSSDDLRAGDVFIVGGFPGHAVLILDVAVHQDSGEKIFLLAQSYMPAQDMHVLKNPADPRLSPWYASDFGAELRTPEWTFQADQLKRFAGSAQAPSAQARSAQMTAAQKTSAPPEELACLVKHYGGRATLDSAGKWALELSPEEVFPFDDEKDKTPEQVLESPDLKDTLTDYPRGLSPSVKEKRTDAGRARHLGLLRAVYGDSEPVVREQLVPVVLGENRVLVHRRVQDALGRVAAKIERLRRGDPSLAVYFSEMGGGFRFRTIEGTSRLSAHAFGIAVDLNPKQGAYYRWTPEWDGKYPKSLVLAFESEGFIWGGAWEHFDSMHFEYRPELLDPACAGHAPQAL